MLLYENQFYICFSFLLDRLLQYEKLDEASDDSDATDITDEIGSNSTARSQNRYHQQTV